MNVLIVSDIHANLVALDAVLADCGEFDAIWNLGDTIGYGPRPAECVQRMIEIGSNPMLTGNHDLASIGQLDDQDFNAVARAAARWTSAQLSSEQKAFLKALPSIAVEQDFTLAHGSPRDPISEYIASSETAAENFPLFSTDICCVGHTHVASSFALRPGSNGPEMAVLLDGQALDLSSSRFIINPGSVGQPRDRDPRAAYGLLSTEDRVFTSHRVAYDIRATQQQMEEAKLPAVLIKRLAYGR